MCNYDGRRIRGLASSVQAADRRGHALLDGAQRGLMIQSAIRRVQHDAHAE